MPIQLIAKALEDAFWLILIRIKVQEIQRFLRQKDLERQMHQRAPLASAAALIVRTGAATAARSAAVGWIPVVGWALAIGLIGVDIYLMARGDKSAEEYDGHIEAIRKAKERIEKLLERLRNLGRRATKKAKEIKKEIEKELRRIRGHEKEIAQK